MPLWASDVDNSRILGTHQISGSVGLSTALGSKNGRSSVTSGRKTEFKFNMNLASWTTSALELRFPTIDC